jgi:hypothetical protein
LGFCPHSPQYLPTVKSQGWADGVRRRARSAHHFRPNGGLVRPPQRAGAALQPRVSGRASQRFAERDGMVFLPDQVAEYDKKRMQVRKGAADGNVCRDERSAIDWLTDFLKKRPSTYQESSPRVHQVNLGPAGRSTRPSRSSRACWKQLPCYVPDGKDGDEVPVADSQLSLDQPQGPAQSGQVRPTPESQGQGPLVCARPEQGAGPGEEAREGAAEGVRDLPSATGRKLKEFRLEVLRAGFKARGRQDYATIIAIAQKMPEEALQEDEKLLLWYDQALTRTEAGA